MRPITRGGAPRVYRRYRDAIDDLEGRLGPYCSYCERRLPVSLAVEHVSPKSTDPARELDWSNYLLSCTNCNSVKNNQQTNDNDFLWPDRDNTLKAFEYGAGGFVSLEVTLPDEVRPRAENLMKIVGLNRHRQRGWPRPAKGDKRWEQRRDVWLAAMHSKNLLQQLENSPAARELVVTIALGYGFFSVWMKVFAGDQAMRTRLIRAFTGTAQDCFDADGQAVSRPSGRI